MARSPPVMENASPEIPPPNTEPKKHLKIKIAKAWSYATENVQRQSFTDNSLKKIDEREEEKRKEQLKKKKAESFKTIVEMNNRKLRTRKESD